MAVLIEGVSIVVRIATIERWHDGGLEDFFEWISGFRYCYDDHLVAVHFKRNDTVREILDQIKQRPMRLKDELDPGKPSQLSTRCSRALLPRAIGSWSAEIPTAPFSPV